jgi:hypothetical protein
VTIRRMSLGGGVVMWGVRMSGRRASGAKPPTGRRQIGGCL